MSATDFRPRRVLAVDLDTGRVEYPDPLRPAGHTQAQLHGVRYALAKFDDASYGECEECGSAIGFSRLQARPEARLCIACQTRAEKR